MLYNFLANRKKRHGDTRIGQWNAQRLFKKTINIMDKAEVLKGNVLEVGPGEGLLANLLVNSGLTYKGFEQSPGLRVGLIEQGLDVDLGTAPPLPYQDNQFDLVCVFSVLEHMPTFNEALDLLLECRRVLKPGGSLVVEVPDMLREGFEFYQWDYSHAFITTPFRVRQVLSDAGFEEKGITHFTGSLTGPIRFPFDLLGFIVHSRFVYWLGYTFGLESWLVKYHKSLAAGFMIICQKPSEEEYEL